MKTTIYETVVFLDNVECITVKPGTRKGTDLHPMARKLWMKKSKFWSRFVGFGVGTDSYWEEPAVCIRFQSGKTLILNTESNRHATRLVRAILDKKALNKNSATLVQEIYRYASERHEAADFDHCEGFLVYHITEEEDNEG